MVFYSMTIVQIGKTVLPGFWSSRPFLFSFGLTCPPLILDGIFCSPEFGFVSKKIRKFDRVSIISIGNKSLPQNRCFESDFKFSKWIFKIMFAFFLQIYHYYIRSYRISMKFAPFERSRSNLSIGVNFIKIRCGLIG